ncbi:MAG: bifunctional alpha/beta hydrolase/OsmC family protein [Nocardioides sp.]
MATFATKLPVTFPGGSDAELVGTLDLPAGRPRATALFAHCFTCSSTTKAASRISGALAERGIAVLRFDFTGLGSSDGDFAETTFTSNVADLVAAARWMGSDAPGAPGAPSLLVGHSLGGAAVIAAADALEHVCGVAVVGAPSSPEHIEHLLSDAVPSPDSPGGRHLQVRIGGRTLLIGQDLIDDIADQRQLERIGGLGRALLVLHSPIDEIVGVDEARKIFEAARHPKSFVALDGADHLLTRPADSRFAASVIAAWAERYLPPAPEQTEQPAAPAAVEGSVTVREVDPAHFAHDARVPKHVWRLDEPASVGGEDTGPNPYDTMLSALGACTSMTMRMYARRKGWEFGATMVQLTHDRVHAKDCKECESSTGHVDRIHRVITLDPALDDEQRRALLLIADKCPVHRTLTHEVLITTEAATSG